MKTTIVKCTLISIAFIFANCNTNNSPGTGSSVNKSNSGQHINESKPAEKRYVNCGHCGKKLYEGEPSVGSLTAPGKYFCDENCADLYLLNN